MRAGPNVTSRYVPGLSQTSKMESFATIVNAFSRLKYLWRYWLHLCEKVCYGQRTTSVQSPVKFNLLSLSRNHCRKCFFFFSNPTVITVKSTSEVFECCRTQDVILQMYYFFYCKMT